MVSSPASIAGLPACSAVVWVAPPLFASGPRLMLLLTVALPQVLSSARLYASAASVPLSLKQFWAGVLLPTMVLRSVSVPLPLKMPVASPALLAEKVLLVMSAVPD